MPVIEPPFKHKVSSKCFVGKFCKLPGVRHRTASNQTRESETGIQALSLIPFFDPFAATPIMLLEAVADLLSDGLESIFTKLRDRLQQLDTGIGVQVNCLCACDRAHTAIP